MPSELDIPNLPFKKPIQLEKLEQLDYSQREAMDPIERLNRINEAAHSIAHQYVKKKKKDYNGCFLTIKAALTELGNSLGGNFGAYMVGISEKAAQDACDEIFENDPARLSTNNINETPPAED